jgi:hypothetical protein
MNPSIGEPRVKKLLVLVGATLGSYAGWAAGAWVGTMTAFILSVVGTGFGMYAGAKLAGRLLD